MRVAIVGAGPAGCAAAIELRRRGAEVVVIGDGADGIGEQMPPEARPLLQRLGLLPLDGHLACVGVRSAWRTEELRDQDFLLRPFGHGWLLDRRGLGAQMRTRARAAGAELGEPARLISLRRGAGWCLALDTGEIRCDWVVDASGRRAAVARLLGVRRRHFDRQFALVGWLETEDEDEDATLTVETADEGWWYTCRLPGRRRVAAWITATAPDLGAWEARLRATRHVAALTRAYRLCGRVVACPAESSILERTSGPGWLAIGDAAISYDPLASRGLVAALESGLGAAALVGASAERLAAHHRNLEQRFRRYLEERRQHY